MVGSMVCTLPIGLGLSKTRKAKKICIVDGDGALLMRLGNLALASQMKPMNLVHVLLDNGVHDSTGGQQTYSESIDFSNIANSCGYENIFEVDHIQGFEKALKNSISSGKLSFIRLIIKPGSPEDLGRPTVTPRQVAKRFREHFTGD